MTTEQTRVCTLQTIVFHTGTTCTDGWIGRWNGFLIRHCSPLSPLVVQEKSASQPHDELHSCLVIPLTPLVKTFDHPPFLPLLLTDVQNDHWTRHCLQVGGQKTLSLTRPAFLQCNPSRTSGQLILPLPIDLRQLM